MRAAHKARVEEVGLLVTPLRTVEEVVLHTEHDDGARIDLPVAIVADHDGSARLHEIRIYFSNWPIRGGHAIRLPLLQPDPDVHEEDIIGEYQRALAAGDVEGVVMAFEPNGYFREPAGGRYTIAAPTSCAPSTGCSSRGVAVYRWSTAAPPTTAEPALWSTTSSPGAISSSNAAIS